MNDEQSPVQPVLSGLDERSAIEQGRIPEGWPIIDGEPFNPKVQWTATPEQRVCILSVGHGGLHRGEDGSEWSWFETTGHRSPATPNPEQDR